MGVQDGGRSHRWKGNYQLVGKARSYSIIRSLLSTALHEVFGTDLQLPGIGGCDKVDAFLWRGVVECRTMRVVPFAVPGVAAGNEYSPAETAE